MRIRPVEAFSDNYIWVLDNEDSQAACVVDPGDAEPVLAFLQSQKLDIAAILITHHHADHIGGVERLRNQFPAAAVYGPISPNIATVTMPVVDADAFELMGRRFEVLAVPGHTMDHIAYYAPGDASSGAGGVLFCGDTLFAAGCGRIFEGTPEIMYHSLGRLGDLPPSTLVYCAHEYTVANLRFALAVEPENDEIEERLMDALAMRAEGKPTLPSRIELELRTNPFLRCHIQAVGRNAESAAKTRTSSEVEVFAALRQWKNNFRA